MAKSNTDKRLYNNVWFQILIGSLILTPIGNAIYDNTKSVPILTFFILKPLSIVWKWIIGILIFKVSIWVILVCIIIVLIILLLVDKIFYSRTLGLIKDPAFASYNKDIFKKWLWEWQYEIDEKTYNIVRLRPLCVKDETPLVDNGSHGLICPRCDTRYGDSFYMGEYSNFEDINSIRVLIEHNIKIRYNNK